MTPSELKAAVEAANPDSNFFTRKTMAFFGDTMANYGVRHAVVVVSYDVDGKYLAHGRHAEVWELYRRRPVAHGNQASAYFDKATFRRVFVRA